MEKTKKTGFWSTFPQLYPKWNVDSLISFDLLFNNNKKKETNNVPSQTLNNNPE